MAHLLVTNDFPPKVGGIQSYLWELWRRLPDGQGRVLTTPHAGAVPFDEASPLPIQRDRTRVLVPSPQLLRRILAAAAGDLVVLDPAWLVGHLGPSLAARGIPYALVLHGAEVTVPGRLPAVRRLMERTLLGARLLICAGGYPEAEAARAVGGTHRLPPVVQIPPGVDVERFVPLTAPQRLAARARLGVPVDRPLIVAQSRLVPRKGFDTLIRAAARLRANAARPDLVDLHVAIGGGGRDRSRLEREARRAGVPVTFLGRVADDDLPAVFAMGDVFAMCCRTRWAGLEQEGFGIVFLEAAAAGVPQVAGRSGGAHEAVQRDVSGLVVDRPFDPAAVAHALGRLVGELDGAPQRRASLADAGRRRAVDEFAYPMLSSRLSTALGAVEAATALG